MSSPRKRGPNAPQRQCQQCPCPPHSHPSPVPTHCVIPATAGMTEWMWNGGSRNENPLYQPPCPLLPTPPLLLKKGEGVLTATAASDWRFAGVVWSPSHFYRGRGQGWGARAAASAVPPAAPEVTPIPPHLRCRGNGPNGPRLLSSDRARNAHHGARSHPNPVPTPSVVPAQAGTQLSPASESRQAPSRRPTSPQSHPTPGVVPRRRESRRRCGHPQTQPWIPACAGMTSR